MVYNYSIQSSGPDHGGVLDAARSEGEVEALGDVAQLLPDLNHLLHAFGVYKVTKTPALAKTTMAVIKQHLTLNRLTLNDIRLLADDNLFSVDALIGFEHV